jgi:hypothetical protein
MTYGRLFTITENSVFEIHECFEYKPLVYVVRMTRYSVRLFGEVFSIISVKMHDVVCVGHDLCPQFLRNEL